MARGGLAMVLFAALVGCGGAPPSAVGKLAGADGRLPLTVVVSGDATQQAALTTAFQQPLGLKLDVRLAELPNAAAAPPLEPAIEAALVGARRAYIDADFARCSAALPDGKLGPLLAQGQRTVAARWQFWRVACRVGEQALAEATLEAKSFAAYQLELPDAVEVASPEVEQVLVEAERTVSTAAPVKLTVAASAPARVSVDGRPRGCVTPCTLSLRPGEHVVALDADGFQPTWQTVRTEAPTSVTLPLTAAAPELAGAQWSARFAGSAGQESAASLALLATATRARSLLLVVAEPGRGGARLRGALAVDGLIAARAEHAQSADGPRELLRELLTRAHLVDPGPPLYKRKSFWFAIAGATAAAAGVTALILFQPPTRTRLEFR